MREQITMKRVIDLRNISIPSVNHKYMRNPKTGRLVLAPEYRSFKNMLTSLCAKTKIKGPYAVRINIATAGDINNAIKPILDAIEDAGVVDDDQNVMVLAVEKSFIQRGAPGALRVWVGTYGVGSLWDD